MSARTSAQTDAADEGPDAQAMRSIAAVHPQWSGIRLVGSVTQGQAMRVYHAGPPYQTPQHIPAPVLNSMAYAVLLEHWASDFDGACALLRSGAVQTLTCQDHGLLVPLAGVLSPSMAVQEISDAASELAPCYAALNEGPTHATRLGRRDGLLLAHLQWLNGPFAQTLASRLSQTGPLALLPLMERAVALGDDCHARTLEGSQLVVGALQLPTDPAGLAAQHFLDSTNAFALNLWMGAAALCLKAAQGQPHATLVTRAGGNGVEFGIALAGRPGQWVCAPAPVPQGTVEPEHAGARALGALGDSAVVDFFGFGAQALACAPAVLKALAPALPPDALKRRHKVLQAPSAPGRANATSALRCDANDCGPLVLLGMIDQAGQAGRIGAGCVDVAPALLRRALAPRGGVDHGAA